MAITITISDASTTATFSVIAVPLVSQPVIAESDIVTIDNNISTYYTGTKRAFEVEFGYMDKDAYAILLGFRDRQYTNMKYPTITFSGADNLPSVPITAKMVMNEQRIVDNCGTVEMVKATFRESRQML